MSGFAPVLHCEDGHRLGENFHLPSSKILDIDCPICSHSRTGIDHHLTGCTAMFLRSHSPILSRIARSVLARGRSFEATPAVASAA